MVRSGQSAAIILFEGSAIKYEELHTGFLRFRLETDNLHERRTHTDVVAACTTSATETCIHTGTENAVLA